MLAAGMPKHRLGLRRASGLAMHAARSSAAACLRHASCSIAVTCNESECLTDRSGEMSFEHSVTEVHGH
jgi:hypothetical protein